MTAPVYVLACLDASVCVGSTIMLDGDEGHHAVSVRRTRPGEAIDIVNGQGLRLNATVESIHKKSLVACVKGVVDEGEPAPRRIIVQALAKGGRDEQAVETCTEYGAHSFIPWQAQRSIASWKGKESKGLARWAATAHAAAKQSRRAWIPPIYADVPSSPHVAELIREAIASGVRVYLCHEEAEATLAQSVIRDGEGEETWVIIGPEGGISVGERALFEEAGATTVRLGAHVLRTASAGAYALAALETAYGASGKVKA